MIYRTTSLFAYFANRSGFFMHIVDYLNYLEYEKRYSKHTISSYKKDLEQCSSFLHKAYDGITIEKAEALMLRSWIVSLVEEGLSSKSINRKLSSLKSFYKFLYTREEISSLPTSKLIAPKLSKKLPHYVKEGEMDNLLNRVSFDQEEKEEFALRDKLIIELFYATGIRLSELINIQLKDISWANRTIKVLGKRNKERIIPIHDSLVQDIETYIRLSKESRITNYLLLTNSNKKLYPKFVYRKVNYYLSQVTSLTKKSPHIIRHTFATHMLNNGADLNTIKEFLGHSNLSATEVYTHNSLEKIKNIYKQAHPRA